MTVHDADVAARTQEIEQLRAKVSRLEAELADGHHLPAERTRRPGRWRWLATGVLLLVAGLLAPLAVVATWVHDEISDTDRYVETVGPLASDPAVQDAAITRVTDGILERLDVEAVTQEAVDALAAQGLDPRLATTLSALATPLANGVRNLIEDAVTKLVQSDQFQEAWVAANREAHAQMVAVLTGKGSDTIEVTGNTVSVNLAAVVDAVKAQLTEAGFGLAERIPEVEAQFTLMESADITKAQSAFRLLSALARALPIVALLLLAAGVLVAPSRRKALVISGLVVAVSMVCLGATLNGFRLVYLDAIPAEHLPTDAAGAIYDQLVGFIRLNLRAVLVLFLALSAVAWVTGPWAPAVAVRRSTNSAVGVVRHGSDRMGIRTGAFGASLYAVRTPIRVGVGALVVILYVMAAHPTGGFTIALLLVAALVLLLVELLARPPEAEGTVTEERPSDA